MSKDIADYTAKDFWIRFLSNYAEDKESGMLKKLCALDEGLHQGAYQKSFETAAAMKALNYPLDDIQKITGLSEEKISKR